MAQCRQYSQSPGSPAGVLGSGSPGAGARDAPRARATGSNGIAAAPSSTVASRARKPRRELRRATCARQTA